jgi:hypothetical protein
MVSERPTCPVVLRAGPRVGQPCCRSLQAGATTCWHHRVESSSPSSLLPSSGRLRELVASLGSTPVLDLATDPLEVLLERELVPGSVVRLTVEAEVGEPTLGRLKNRDVVRVRLAPVNVRLVRLDEWDTDRNRASLEAWEAKQAALRAQRTGVSHQSPEDG